jgi:hypothetical protein
MTRELCISKDSADETFRNLRTPTSLPYEPLLVSPFIDDIIKHELYMMLVKTAGDVLKDLDEMLESEDKTLWAPCLCAVLIICLIAETTQLEQDLNSIYEIQDMEEESREIRDTSINHFLEVEYHLVSHCVNKFHSFKKSRQKSLGKRNYNGFNPIRDGLKLDNEHGLGQPAVTLVDEIRRILRDNGTLLCAL